jgi:regulatory protein
VESGETSGRRSSGPGRPRRPRRSPQALRQLREERAEIDDPTLVMGAALRFLESRARSAAEVRGRLVRHGYRPDLVEGCISRLVELGMLDDAAFAQAWVESRDRARPRGERALRRELRTKGIDREVVDEVIQERADRAAEVDGADADEEAAKRLLERNARALERIADPRARRQRAYALLARNGFDPDVAGSVTRSINLE